METFENFFSTGPTYLILVYFIVGLILIIKGGDWFVDAASWIAEELGVPKFVIGATIVSIATTLPEMIVSITATIKGNLDMAAGNAIGSVTANTAMILAIFLIFMPFAIERKEFAPKGIFVFLASAGLIAGSIFTAKRTLTFEGETNEYYSLSTYGTIFLILIFFVFFIENFIAMKSHDRQITTTPDTIAIVYDDEVKKEKASPAQWVKYILMFLLGAFGTVIGAEILVNSGTKLAEDIHVPQRIISVLAVAIGTSLPELVTTITALRKKEGDLSVGNILGANIIDLTLILPICSFITLGQGNEALALSVSSVTIDMLVCLIATTIVVFPTIITKKLHRWQGIFLMTGYTAYVVATVVLK